MSDENEKESTDPLAEVTAMKEVAEAVGDLDADATARVLRWAVDRFNVAVTGSARGKASGSSSVSAAGESVSENGNGSGAQRFSELAELHATAAPESDADKALVAGYWFQFCEGKPEFGAQESIRP